MVDRIRTLLETRELTPTQFADAIGVARPIVSHILSGRNKPSLDVVQRMLAAMPELSMSWLLNGTGPMLNASAGAGTGPSPVLTPQTAVREPAPAEPIPVSARPATPVKAAFSDINKGHRHASAAPEPHKWPGSSLANSRAVPKRFAPQAAKLETSSLPPVSLPIATPEQPTPAPPPPETADAGPDSRVLAPAAEPEVAAVANPAGGDIAQALALGSEKSIRRIVIFYRDGSFADYQPE